MHHQADDLTHEDVDRLFEAAAALFFVVLEAESTIQSAPVLVPAWFSPVMDPPCPCTMDSAIVEEASDFLVRMGIMRIDEGGHLRIVSHRDGER
tara:strand:- start:2553 stop:2834 length:282 start_codon:yes stop_codon:yes gene_type:complete